MSEDLSRWNDRYRLLADDADDAGRPVDSPPPSALLRLDHLLPRTGTAVDLAGGIGSAALYLAARGMDAVLVDISDVALALARRRAADLGLHISALQNDLAGSDLAAVMAGVGDDHPGAGVALISCFHYLERSLLASVAAGLPAGAMFVAAIATVTNLERNPRPPERFLLQPGELRALVLGDGPDREGLELVHYSEGWHSSDHHEAELVVRKAA
jgi:SAM-dependent methyltransferase